MAMRTKTSLISAMCPLSNTLQKAMHFMLPIGMTTLALHVAMAASTFHRKMRRGCLVGRHPKYLGRGTERFRCARGRWCTSTLEARDWRLEAGGLEIGGGR